MIPSPGAQKCTFFLCPPQNAPTSCKLGWAYSPGVFLGEGLCCLWAEVPHPQAQMHLLKEMEESLHEGIVFLLFPINENTCRSLGSKWSYVKGFWIVFKEEKYCFMHSLWVSLIMNWTHKREEKRYDGVQNSFSIFTVKVFLRHVKRDNRITNPMDPSPWFNNDSLLAPLASSNLFYPSSFFVTTFPKQISLTSSFCP